MSLDHGGSDLPRIVVIGGGTGLSVMLRGLKHMPLDITAIVTVADDGGSSGVLRSEMQIPPPGDLRNVLIALADAEPSLSQVLQYRFPTGTGLAGHNLGNLFLAAMKDITGDFVSGIREMSKVLAVRGRVLPAANHAIVLKAEMEDGSLVVGESRIPKSGKKIKRVYIEPADAAPLDEALAAIHEADGIIVGPGSLYTSILPNLLVPGITEAIKASQAVKVFICNVMTQPGETDGYSAGDHLTAIQSHIGTKLFDVAIVNNGPISPEVLQRYAEKGASPVRFDLDRLEESGVQIIADRLVLYLTYLRHDADKLGSHLYKIVRDRNMRKR